jgi:hypothetical protein
MSGASYNTIRRLENGKMGANPRTIRRITEVLDVELAELVKGEE